MRRRSTAALPQNNCSAYFVCFAVKALVSFSGPAAASPPPKNNSRPWAGWRF
jgi:hypothetical protein